MTTNIPLSDLVKSWVETQTRGGRYGNAGGPIPRDQERQRAQAELQALIAEGLESGVSERSVAYILETARMRLATESTAGDLGFAS